jgi:hypothetical protein
MAKTATPAMAKGRKKVDRPGRWDRDPIPNGCEGDTREIETVNDDPFLLKDRRVSDHTYSKVDQEGPTNNPLR